MKDATRALLNTVLGVAAAILLFGLAPTDGTRVWLASSMGLGAVVIVAPLTVRRARAVRRSDTPLIHAAQAIILVLTLLILGFATTYRVLAIYPGQLVDVKTKIDAVYFTISTLSTVGFGDAHAVGQTARLVVSIQILIDLAVLAVAIKLLTSVANERRAELGPLDGR